MPRVKDQIKDPIIQRTTIKENLILEKEVNPTQRVEVNLTPILLNLEILEIQRIIAKAIIVIPLVCSQL
jgi:hypothetical protein